VITLADDLALDALGRKMADGPPTCSFGANESHSRIEDAYGGQSSAMASRLRNAQLRPLLQYLGFGAQEGTPAARRQQERLAGATGPLAGYIRQLQGFIPGVYDQSQQVGEEMATRGRGAYDLFQNQLNTSLDQIGGYQQSAQRGNELASRYAERAANPLADEDLYQTAQRRVLSQLRPQLAARGLEGASGAAAQAESDALRGLTTDFAGQRRADQYNSLTALEQAGQHGAGLAGLGTQLAGSGMDAVTQLGQFLQSQYGIPMQAMGGILQMLMGGTQPSLALTQATAPQVGQQASGWRIL
jgi:hypothetical protein